MVFILRHFDHKLDVQLHTDPSGVDIGVILIQREPLTNYEDVITYGIRTLSETERPWTAREREFSAVY